MMKYVGPILAGGLTLLLVGLIGLFSFLPAAEPDPTPAPVTPAVVEATATTGPDLVQLEAELARREAVYTEQVTQLDEALQTRQAAYQTQLEELSQQVSAAQANLDTLDQQEAALLGRVAEFEQARTERLAQYETQLAGARRQYESRYTEMQTLLAEIQANTAQARAELGQ